MVKKNTNNYKTQKKTQNGGSKFPKSPSKLSRKSRESRESNKPYSRPTHNTGLTEADIDIDKLKKVFNDIYREIISKNDVIQTILDGMVIHRNRGSSRSSRSRISSRSSRSSSSDYISVIDNIAEIHILYDKIKQILDDIYKMDKGYFKKQFTESGTLEDLYNQEGEIIRLLDRLRINFLDMDDAISFLDKEGKGKEKEKKYIDLSRAESKKKEKENTPETYKNFLDALIYFNYLTKSGYLNEIRQKQDDKKLKIVLVDTENFIMSNAGTNRIKMYDNLGRKIHNYITMNQKEEKFIFILVNHGNIDKDNELFGKITDNIYYVNVKCKPYISCEADDFLLILLAKHFGLKDTDKYDVNLMTRDNYSWFGQKMRRGSLIYSDTGEIVYEYEPFIEKINDFALSLTK
jgi:hypothetical protein